MKTDSILHTTVMGVVGGAGKTKTISSNLRSILEGICTSLANYRATSNDDVIKL